MTLPANLATGRITGTLLDTATGAPLSGTVVFTPNTQVVINPAGLTLHAAKQRDVKLAKDGTFTVDLIATDNPEIQPADWSWRVEFRTSPPLPGFSFSIASGSVQDISQLSPVPESGGTFSAFNIPAELVEQSKVAAENAAATADALATTATSAATSAQAAQAAAEAAEAGLADATAAAVDQATEGVVAEAAASAQAARDAANLVGAPAKDAMDAAMGGNVAGLVPAVAGKVAKGELELNVKDYGAKGDGVTDDTAAIQAALAAGPNVMVPPGTYAIAGTITIPTGKVLRLSAGTTLNRPATFPSTEPLVWLNTAMGALIGAGQRASRVSTANESPLGVVCVGYKGTADTTARTANWCSVRDLSLVGKAAGGVTTGSPSVALLMCNNQINGSSTSYFNDVRGVFLANANIGVHFLGLANANTLSGVQLYSVGNSRNLGGAGFKFTTTSAGGPLENVITGFFHTQSSNAATVSLEGAGINYNVVVGAAEVGGTSAYFLVNNDDTQQGNTFVVSDNAYLGNSLTATFEQKNTLLTVTGLAAKKVSTPTLRLVNPGTKTTAPAAGAAAALPAAPAGYVPVTIDGTVRWLPYYA